MKLEKFKTESPKKKAMIIGSIILVLLVTIVVVYRSFAFFEENQEFNVIKGSVPDQNYDLMLSFQIEDENGNRTVSDTIPKGKEYIIDIKCNNGSTGEWDYENWAPKINNLKNTRTKCTILFQKAVGLTDGKAVYNFDYTGDFQEFIVPYTGTYKIELWGAGTCSGGYTSGIITLSKNTTLFLYVGQTNQFCDPYTSCSGDAYNGGGSGGYFNSTSHHARTPGGGGATDVRLVSGAWNDTTSLNSRIMVASGSGAATNGKCAGGGLVGYVGSDYNQGGAGTQTSGGAATSPATSGGFGYGGYGVVLDPKNSNNNHAYGGGGGYYGGGGGLGGPVSFGNNRIGSSGGGSSFISGHTGCVAIKSETDRTPKEGCMDGTTDINCSIHYSGYQFKDTIMIDGEGYNWTTEKKEQVGKPSFDIDSSNGYARITYILY